MFLFFAEVDTLTELINTYISKHYKASKFKMASKMAAVSRSSVVWNWSAPLARFLALDLHGECSLGAGGQLSWV